MLGRAEHAAWHPRGGNKGGAHLLFEEELPLAIATPRSLLPLLGCLLEAQVDNALLEREEEKVGEGQRRSWKGTRRGSIGIYG